MALSSEEEPEFMVNEGKHTEVSKGTRLVSCFKETISGIFNFMIKVFLLIMIIGLLNRYIVPYGLKEIFTELTIAIIVVILAFRLLFGYMSK